MAKKRDKGKPGLVKVAEMYVDDNVDINLLVQRVSKQLREIKRDYERVVIKVCVEEVFLLNLKEKK